MKKSLILAVKLLVICAVAAAALAYTNSITAPVIAANDAEATKKAYAVVYPEAEDFVTADASLLTENIIEIAEAKVGGATAGYVFKVASPKGYDGPITFVVGAKLDGTVTGFQVLKHTETSGFGAKVTDPEYAEGMNGVVLNAEVTAKGAGGAEHEIPVISGATFTTNAMTKGMNLVVAKLGELTGNVTTSAPAADESMILSVYPQAEEVVALADEAVLNEHVLAVFEAEQGGATVGYVLLVKSPDGFGGPIEFALGVDKAGKIQDFVVLKHTETEGYGLAIEEDGYKLGLVNKTPAEADVAVSGATFTSDAMKAAMTAVSQSLEALK